MASQMQSVRPTVQSETKPLPGLDGQLVLCWVGSTEEPDSVVDVGRALATRSGGQCHVVMVLGECGQAPTSPFGVVSGGNGPLTPETISRANRRLQRLYGEDVEVMALPGHCISEIRRYARNHHATLLVMGPQALAVEQSYGETLHDHAPCTVLIVVPPNYQTGPRSNDAQFRRE